MALHRKSFLATYHRLVRVLRVLVGVIAILIALPLLLGGVVLWAAMQHRADDGSFTAPLC